MANAKCTEFLKHFKYYVKECEEYNGQYAEFLAAINRCETDIESFPYPKTMLLG